MSADRRELRRELIRQVDAGELTPQEGLKLMRKVLGLTQAAYAEKVGVAPRTLTDFERKAGNPTLRTLEKLFAPFGFELTLRRRGSRAVGELRRTLGEPAYAELEEAAAVEGRPPAAVLAEALRTYLALPARIHERSALLGRAEGLEEAAGRAPDQAPALTRAARRARDAADRTSWTALDRPWPTDDLWRVELDGVVGPRVRLAPPPAVGELVFDRGRYFELAEVRDAERVIALCRRADTDRMRTLRREHPERFRRIAVRSLR